MKVRDYDRLLKENQVLRKENAELRSGQDDFNAKNDFGIGQ